jgi:hypothetical protein
VVHWGFGKRQLTDDYTNSYHVRNAKNELIYLPTETGKFKHHNVLLI